MGKSTVIKDELDISRLNHSDWELPEFGIKCFSLSSYVSYLFLGGIL